MVLDPWKCIKYLRISFNFILTQVFQYMMTYECIWTSEDLFLFSYILADGTVNIVR